ncbi:lipoprotein YteS [Bacillus swezeyi]|uniref:Lipoprotein YteS n=2 Tax=Bacillus swezeyi TaxID=1925020 RepID=A0A1R1RWN5_9BACI|nr:lipoprotein YteS [Bacillus swezeyi]MEC1263089.1 lipoprotein YteS [Bacillus swezeyi]MED2930383.1 lipoprotein YteS [Bacillus swezeyi]MED2944576.1 lipoprotein YteS [Bacillus swezeyi]MED2963925.1 lipoprotein YteS [Bacillus swezeyi]MED2975177.1 lipoprotein YteS [Bacillus swezeyi]
MKKLALPLLMAIAVLLLSSCGKGETAGTDVFVFSDANREVKENIEKAAGKERLNVTVYPASPEKLLVEIAAKEGDLFIVPEDMFEPFYDPEGLLPLEADQEGRKTYSAPGKNGEKRLYAAVIKKGVKHLNGYTFTLNTDMAAFIPIYAKKTAEAMELIRLLQGQ